MDNPANHKSSNNWLFLKNYISDSSFTTFKQDKKHKEVRLDIDDTLSMSSIDDSSMQDTNEYNSHDTVEEYEMQFKENTDEKKDYSTILTKSKLRKLSLHAVENQVDKYYNDDNHSFSSALDILARYLKGQKTIYIEAKEFSEWRLTCLM